MKLEGKLLPPHETKSKYWAAEIPVIGLYTQGTRQQDAIAMVKDAIHSLNNDLKVDITLENNSTFLVGCKNQKAFLAFIFSRIRIEKKLNTREAALKLNSKSPNTLGRYEQGKAIPRLDTLEEILKALNPKINLILRAS